MVDSSANSYINFTDYTPHETLTANTVPTSWIDTETVPTTYSRLREQGWQNAWRQLFDQVERLENPRITPVGTTFTFNYPITLMPAPAGRLNKIDTTGLPPLPEGSRMLDQTELIHSTDFLGSDRGWGPASINSGMTLMTLRLRHPHIKAVCRVIGT